MRASLHRVPAAGACDDLGDGLLLRTVAANMARPHLAPRQGGPSSVSGGGRRRIH